MYTILLLEKWYTRYYIFEYVYRTCPWKWWSKRHEIFMAKLKNWRMSKSISEINRNMSLIEVSKRKIINILNFIDLFLQAIIFHSTCIPKKIKLRKVLSVTRLTRYLSTWCWPVSSLFPPSAIRSLRTRSVSWEEICSVHTASKCAEVDRWIGLERGTSPSPNITCPCSDTQHISSITLGPWQFPVQVTSLHFISALVPTRGPLSSLLPACSRNSYRDFVRAAQPGCEWQGSTPPCRVKDLSGNECRKKQKCNGTSLPRTH